MSFFGAYPRSTRQESDSEILDFPFCPAVPSGWNSGHCSTDRSLHFSSAPLHGIVRAEVFQRGRGPCCRGILLTYKTGGQRALGDCRLGFDSSQVYIAPVFLCAEPRRYKPDPAFDWQFRLVRVQFQGAEGHEHDEAGWECYKLEGTVNFWFAHDQQYLEVIQAADTTSRVD